MIGFYLGMWAAAVVTCAYALLFMFTHPYGDNVWGFYLLLSFGPLWMLALRCWKWVLTLALLAFGWHELHKLATVWKLVSVGIIGWQASKPENRKRLAKYGRWLTDRTEGDLKPEKPSARAKDAMRATAVLGFAVYLLAAFSVYPQHPVLTGDTPIAEPTPPQQSYSQNTPLIHNDYAGYTRPTAQCIAPSTQTQAERAAQVPYLTGTIYNPQAPDQDDPEAIQAAYNYIADVPYTNTLKWVHHGRVYRWDSTHEHWRIERKHQ